VLVAVRQGVKLPLLLQKTSSSPPYLACIRHGFPRDAALLIRRDPQRPKDIT